MSTINTEEQWFTEKCSESGSAFSLEINHRLHEEQSPYQKIEVYSTKHFGNLLVIDGFIMLSSKDNFIYHEMIGFDTLKFFAYMLPFVILGTFFGRKLLTVLSQKLFNYLVLLFAGVSSMMLLLF